MNVNRDMDLLNGPIFPKIIRFSIPVLLTNLLQTLFNSADMVVVGLSGVDGALGAIGTTLAMICLVINIFLGLSVGAGIVVSRYVGEGNKDKQSRAVHTAVLSSFACGIICMIIGLLISKPTLIFLGDEGHILDLAIIYTRIYFFCVPFVSVSNFLIAVFRAKGDSKTPLAVMTMAGILNILLNLFFVLVCRMSVDGVAWATAISNLFSSAYLLITLSHDSGTCRLELKKLKIDFSILKEILYHGIPSALQTSMFAITGMIIQGSITSLNNIVSPGGSIVIDGNAAANSIDSFASTAAGSVTTSAITMVSQHKGAGNYPRLRRVITDYWITIVILNLVFPLTLLLFRKPLISLYVQNPASAAIAEQRLIIMLSLYVLQGFMDVGSGIARGLGKSIPSVCVSLFFMCVFRIIWIIVLFPKYQTYSFIIFTYPITWFLSAVGQVLIIRNDLKKHKEICYDKE